MDLYCFDMDGTVLDSMKTLEIFAVEVMRQTLDLPSEVALQSYRQTVGLPFSEQMKQICTWGPELVITASRVYEQLHEAALPLFSPAPKIKDALQEVIDTGHVTALVTSTAAHMVKKLTVVNELPFTYFNGFSGRFYKHHQIDKTVEKMTRDYEPPHKVLLFGDSLSDAKCAQLVGAQFFQVNILNVADTVRRVVRGARV